MSVKPKKAVENLPPYKAARSSESVKSEYGLDSVLKLSANENTLGFSPKVREALEKVDSYYPDRAGTALRTAIAKKFNVDVDNVILGNGSFELIQLLSIAFLESGEETIGAVPSFGWYKTTTTFSGGKFIGVPVKDFKVDLDAIAQSVTEKTKIIWLCNPNNPTGTIFTEKELTAFLSKIRNDILVVLDEAYVDFVEEEGFPDSIGLLSKFDNIVILRTFSKAYGLAGLRSGFAIAEKGIISILNRIRIPSNASSAAQLASLAALEDSSFREKTVKNASGQKKVWYSFFERHGLKYIKSNANFMFFDLGREAKPLLQEFLKNGIMLRDGAEFGFPTMIRATLGSPEENQRVIDANKAIKEGNVNKLIDLINESRVSSTELLHNMYVDKIEGSPLEACELILKASNNKAGVKINGGGFAGSVISLVPNSELDNVIKAVKDKYGDKNVHLVSVRNDIPSEIK